MTNKDIKIDVDFKDTCIDFGRYVTTNIENGYSVSKGYMTELWKQYQEQMTEEVFKVLNQEPQINPKMLLTKEECHNKRYYEQGRNGWTPTDTKDCCINPKMMMSKDELGLKDESYDELFDTKIAEGVCDLFEGTKNNHKILKVQPDYKEDKIPNYYIGKNGYEARKVVDNFDLSYNVGTCVTYLLRCGKKTEEGMDIRDKHIEDIQKGINHLLFEIERLKE